MNFKRIMALLLVACFCMSALMLASCNGPVDYTGDGTQNTDNGAFSSGDYDGEVFTFAKFTSSTATNEYYCGQWIDSEGMTGEAVNDAIFTRNANCQDKYNVVIEEKLLGEDAEDIRTYYMANDFCFDVIYSWGSRLGTAITNNWFYNFRTLHDAGYINMEADYWSPAANEQLTFGGKTYIAVNDITMSKLSWTGCMFFNPLILEEYNLENPHDLVDANKWTIDKFLEMVSAVSYDLDGSGGEITKDDRYGYITHEHENGLLAGCGVTTTVKNGDKYALAIGEEKVLGLLEKFRENILNNKGHVFQHSTIVSGADMTGYDEWEYSRSYFAKGHSLFIGGTPEITREFRGMENGYGVVPLPKYDDKQTEYCALIDANAGLFAVPNALRNDGINATYERTGTILEYLAYLSGNTETSDSVVNAYYETTIKGQRQTIAKNKDMLEIVKQSGRYDWTDVLVVGGYDKTVNDTLKKMYQTSGMSSILRGAEKRLTNAINDTYDAVAALD